LTPPLLQQNWNFWIYCQNRHSWSGLRDDTTGQIWWQSIRGGILGQQCFFWTPTIRGELESRGR